MEKVLLLREIPLLIAILVAIVFAPNILRPPYEGVEGLGIMMEGIFCTYFFCFSSLWS